MTRLALVITLATACGSNIPAGDDPGEGSNTLEIEASLNIENNFDNATLANDFATEVSVVVRRADIAVLGAIVTLDTNDGPIELIADAEEDGRYRAVTTGYAKRYQLDIDSGDDFVSGVRLEGPDLHSFATPLAGATVPGDAELLVEWERGETAEVAAIETREMDKITIEDTGSFVIPASALKSDEGEINDERIRLWRTNQVSLDGGAGNSTLAVSIRNELTILVEP